jgi:transcription initiation factor TFIIIB Brf1 subunit/transcription initiation factor TFIIB
MNNCPFCSGKLIITASRAGEEIYCNKCLRVIKSASLKFSYKSTDFAGEVNDCSEGGLPGFKGAGKKAKCHVYQPGDDAAKETARQKARQSSYTTLKNSHIENLIRESAFGGMDTTQVPEFATTNGEEDHNNHFGPSEQIPDEAVGTQIGEDGVWNSNPANNINNNSVSTAY